MAREVVVGLHAVIVAVTAQVARVVVLRRPRGPDALPVGPLDPAADRTLERGLRRWVRDQTGLDLAYVEQLYTFGDRGRDPDAPTRALSIAYLALVREGPLAAGGPATWTDVYRHLPWEDRRRGATPPPAAMDEWVVRDHAPPTRRDRADIAFGTGGAAWDGARALDRFELLWEAGLVPESGAGRAAAGTGAPLVGDHRRMLATAVGRLRGKLGYRPVIFELLPPSFTLLELQQVVEALAGVRLHKPNFRRLVERGGLVERTGDVVSGGRGRPAERFRFRREVLRERPAPGVTRPR